MRVLILFLLFSIYCISFSQDIQIEKQPGDNERVEVTVYQLRQAVAYYEAYKVLNAEAKELKTKVKMLSVCSGILAGTLIVEIIIHLIVLKEK